MKEPTPRQEVFDAYWRFPAERLQMMMRRYRGEPAPWTKDPILNEHKFCNTYRAADRVSQYMIRDVLYAEPNAAKVDQVFRAVAFRIFSRNQTWERLKQELGGQPSISQLQDGSFLKALDTIEADGNGLYTAAFIVPPPTKFTDSGVKHRGHAALFHHMFIVKEAADRIVDAGSLGAVYDVLHEFPYIGDFLAYQAAVDVNYSNAIDFSENDFTKPGPGAVRGLEKVFTSLNGNKPEAVIQWMVENQASQFERLGLDFPGLFGRPLHAIDCQGLFCEIDKYSRAAFPELASNRVKIKAKFKADPLPLPELFFPPKWGINDRIAEGLAGKRFSLDAPRAAEPAPLPKANVEEKAPEAERTTESIVEVEHVPPRKWEKERSMQGDLKRFF